jgi:hypothetical protein
MARRPRTSVRTLGNGAVAAPGRVAGAPMAEKARRYAGGLR